MEVKYNDFLGLKSSKFNSNFCTVSIVDYESTVSEEWHCHEHFHLTITLKGGNLESRTKEDIQVLPGKLLVYNQHEIHCNRFTRFPSKNLNLEIKDTFFKEHDLTPNNLNTQSGATDNYFSIVKLYRELMINDQYTGDAIHASLRSMFSKNEKSHTKPLWLKKLQDIIEGRWDEFISLEDLALEIQVHPVTISRYFRKYCHCTLSDYMRKIKIEKALHMMLHTKNSITEIAFICGFSDHSHMTRSFKLYLGFNPKEISRL